MSNSFADRLLNRLVACIKHLRQLTNKPLRKLASSSDCVETRGAEPRCTLVHEDSTTESTSTSAISPWVVCLTAGLFFFYEFFQLNIFDVINSQLRQDFNLDAKGISWMSSAFVWANVVFLLPAGIILDNFSPKKVIIIALLTCIIGTLGFALTHNFILATFFHALTGIGNAFCFLSCVILVTRWFPPRKQALVIGLIVTMAFTGGMAAHTPFAYLNNAIGWRNSILVDVALGLFILMLIVIYVHDKNHVHKNHEEESKKLWFKKFLVSLKNMQTWLAGIYTACLNLPIMVLCALWGGSYLMSVHKINAIHASNIVSLIFIGSIIGCPFLGWLSDKNGKRKPTMLYGALFTLILFIPLAMGTNLSVTMLSCIFFGLGFITSAQVISYPLIAESNPLQNTGVATGIASVVIMSGAGFSQILFGFIMDSSAHGAQYTAEDFQRAILIFPIASLLALIAVLLTKETFCSENLSSQKSKP